MPFRWTKHYNVPSSEQKPNKVPSWVLILTRTSNYFTINVWILCSGAPLHTAGALLIILTPAPQTPLSPNYFFSHDWLRLSVHVLYQFFNFFKTISSKGFYSPFHLNEVSCQSFAFLFFRTLTTVFPRWCWFSSSLSRGFCLYCCTDFLPQRGFTIISVIVCNQCNTVQHEKSFCA